MTDLIDRLRSVDRVFATEAADRIEALERENAELRQKVQRLQARYEPPITQEEWDSACGGLGTKGRMG